MALWSEVAAGTYTAGRLFTPNLALKMMGRDFAAFAKPFDSHVASTAYAGGALTTVATLYVCYPTTWTADATWPVVAELTIPIAVTALADPADSVDISLDGGYNTETHTGTTGIRWYDLKMRWTTGSASGGVTSVNLQAVGDACTIRRTFGERGPDCRFAFVEV